MGSVDVARIAVVDEHDVVRVGIESVVDQHPHLEIAGSFARPTEYLEWLPTGRGVGVLVTEIQENGYAPDLHRLRDLCAATRAVVVHSRLTATEVILSCLDAGALSYVAKDDGLEQLMAALGRVCAGRRYVTPRMSEAIERARNFGRLNLSDREKQVLTAWLRTDSKEDVAQSLHIAVATVRTHVQRVRMKYANAGRPAPTKSALLARAIEDGIVGLSDLCVAQSG